MPAMTAKHNRGAKVHSAVNTLAHLLALHVTPAGVGDRAAVAHLAADVQEATRHNVSPSFVDQATLAKPAAEAAKAEEITLHVVKLPEAKRGFVLMPRRWVIKRSFARATRCRRLVKGYESYAETLASFHLVAFIRIHAQASNSPGSKCMTRSSRNDALDLPERM